MFKYSLTSTPSFDVNEKVLDSIQNAIYKIVTIPQKWILNIVFLDQDSIQKLNKKYRKVDKTTDVLSFHYFDDFSKLKNENIAWEIILSEKKIISNWKTYKLWTEKEFYKLIIHSTLHILWYDHELDNEYKNMQYLEKKIWKEVFDK